MSGDEDYAKKLADEVQLVMSRMTTLLSREIQMRVATGNLLKAASDMLTIREKQLADCTRVMREQAVVADNLADRFFGENYDISVQMADMCEALRKGRSGE